MLQNWTAYTMRENMHSQPGLIVQNDTLPSPPGTTQCELGFCAQRGQRGQSSFATDTQTQIQPRIRPQKRMKHNSVKGGQED